MEVLFLSYFKDLILTSLLYKVPREQRTKSRLRAKGSLKMMGSIKSKSLLVILGSYHSILVEINFV